MKLTIESTTHVVTLNGVPARVWEGITESGVHVHCYVTRIAVPNDSPAEQERFARELQEHRVPSLEVQAIPLRMVL